MRVSASSGFTYIQSQCSGKAAVCSDCYVMCNAATSWYPLAHGSSQAWKGGGSGRGNSVATSKRHALACRPKLAGHACKYLVTPPWSRVPPSMLSFLGSTLGSRVCQIDMVGRLQRLSLARRMCLALPDLHAPPIQPEDVQQARAACCCAAGTIACELCHGLWHGIGAMYVYGLRADRNNNKSSRRGANSLTDGRPPHAARSRERLRSRRWMAHQQWYWRAAGGRGQ